MLKHRKNIDLPPIIEYNPIIVSLSFFCQIAIRQQLSFGVCHMQYGYEK